MADANTVGVVTVTYNSGTVIDEFLDSLRAQTHGDFILYVVDNHSTDDTLARLARHDDPRVRVLANQENAGVAGGNNQGIEAARHDGCGLVLLLNNDTVFGPDLIAALAAGLERYQCALIVPKMYFHDEPQRIWCAGGRFLPWRGYECRHDGLDEMDRGQFETARPVGYAPTCCMLIRSAVFARIGIMDANYFVYYDDTDFCFRATRAGFRLFYLPDTCLWHKVSSLTGDSDSAFTVGYKTRNRVYFIRKNLPWLPQMYSLVFCQAGPWKRLLLRRDGPTRFLLQQRSYFRGLALSRQPRRFQGVMDKRALG